MSSHPRSIGIIAGSGIYPATFIEAARMAEPETRLILISFEEETDPALADHVDEHHTVRVGQLSKLIKFLLRHNVSEAVMIGQISPNSLFSLRPDLRILMMLARVKKRNAETLFGAIAEELAKDKITLLPATTFLEKNLPEVGHIAGPPLRSRTLDDLDYGFKIAKQTSSLDIGQSVVIRHGTILAVEAFEGTNACIRRGGELGKGKNTVLVKVSKPNQDLRFDVPVIGPDTIKNCAKAGISTIGIEAGMTLLLDLPSIYRLCDSHKITIQALE